MIHTKNDIWNRALQAIDKVDVFGIGVIAFLVMSSIIMIAPFIWMVSTSVQAAELAYQLPPVIIPGDPSIDAFRELRGLPIPYFQAYWNSYVVATLTTFGVIVSCTMAAFAFSRLRFRGRTALFSFMLVGLMVPPALLLVPLYFGLGHVGLLDTIWALVLPSLASPFGVFMMRQFMLDQPREYEEAALIDGATYWRIFWHVSLPQMRPAIAALSIIVFTTSWNNFLMPLVLVRKLEAMTLPMIINSMNSISAGLSLTVVMAGVTLAVLPLLVVFLVAQRYIIEGVTGSGIKG